MCLLASAQDFGSMTDIYKACLAMLLRGIVDNHTSRGILDEKA